MSPPRVAENDVPELHGDTRKKPTPRGAVRRLLFEMMAGDVITDGWKSEEVKGRARSLPGVQRMQRTNAR